MGGQEYQAVIARLGELACRYFTGMESVMENFHLSQLPQSQEEVRTRFGGLLSQAQEELSQLQPQAERQDFHRQLLEGYTHLQRSCQLFCQPVPPEQGLLCLRGCRMEMCESMRRLYPLRRQVPGLDRYWLTPDQWPNLEKLETPAEPPPGVPLGLLYRHGEPAPPHYTLYVPENYHPGRKWPLIVQLHGGGGNDHDSVWLWLRYAKSHGYILMAPKSTDFTWVFSDFEVVVLPALKEVASIYHLDPKGIFLTGVSDGGTFSYEFGLSHPELFAAIAPVAGAFVPWPWHDYPRASRLPVFILHGARDGIIPVDFARQAKKVLGGHGFTLVYRELPEWGHAWPFSKIPEMGAFFDGVLKRQQEGQGEA